MPESGSSGGFQSFLNGTAAIVKGMSLTFSHMFKKKTTVQWPEEREGVKPRYRGRHVLERYDNGLEKCIGCELCAGACPADCILVEAAENTETNRVSPGERFAARYEINMSRCIFCGLCEEACPTGAIVLKHDYELADYDIPHMIYTKEMMLVPDPRDPRVTAARQASIEQAGARR